MYGKQLSDNLNKINSYHDQDDDEEDRQDLLFGISEVPDIEACENFNPMQNQDDQDIFLSNNSILINQDKDRKINQVVYSLKINDFSQQKIRKNFNLYGHPKIDDASNKNPKIKSRIYKQYISHRTKMKTDKFE